MQNKSFCRQVIEHLQELEHMSELSYFEDRELTEDLLIDYPVAEGVADLVMMKIDRALKLPGKFEYDWTALHTLELMGYKLTDMSHGRLKLQTKVGYMVIPKPF